MVDGTIRASIENVLLIRPHHGCRITRSDEAEQLGSPLVPEELIARGIPENMADGTVGVSIENVLLIRPYHGCRIAGSARGVGSGPRVAEKLIARSVPENVRNA